MNESRVDLSYPQERVGIIDKIFLEACKGHDDVGALKLWGYLKIAIFDEHLAPYLLRVLSGEVGGDYFKLDDNRYKEVSEAEYQVGIDHAGKAVSLFDLLPSEKREKRLSKDEPGVSVYREVGVQTLLKTKEALLLAVLNGWKISKDDEVAMAFFNFFLKIKFKHYEDGEVKGKILRQSLEGLNVSAARLVGTVTHFFKTFPIGQESLLPILLHAWVNQTGPVDLVNTLQLFGSVAELSERVSISSCGSVSPAMLEYMLRTGEEMKTLDQAVRKILQKFGHQDVEVIYSDAGTATLSWENSKDNQADCHSEFDHFRSKVHTWLEENRKPGEYRIHLKYQGKSRLTTVPFDVLRESTL
jgi:hypothetical protein